MLPLYCSRVIIFPYQHGKDGASMNIRTKIINTDRNNRDGSSRQDIISLLRPGDQLYLEDYTSDQFPAAIGIETHEYKLCGFLGANIAQDILSHRIPLPEISVIVENLYIDENGLYACVIQISTPAATTAQPPPAKKTTGPAKPRKTTGKKNRRKSAIGIAVVIAILAIALAITLFVLRDRQPSPMPQGQTQQAFLDTASEEEILSYWAGLANATPPPKVVHTGSGNIGTASFVVIKDAVIKQTNDGLNLLETRIEWTNNSEQSRSFSGSLGFTAFQDSNQLKGIPVYADPNRTIDGAYMHQIEDNQNTAIQPGATVEIIQFFKLDNVSSPVEVEISDVDTLDHNDSVVKVFLLQ